MGLLSCLPIKMKSRVMLHLFACQILPFLVRSYKKFMDDLYALRRFNSFVSSALYEKKI